MYHLKMLNYCLGFFVKVLLFCALFRKPKKRKKMYYARFDKQRGTKLFTMVVYSNI